MQITFTINNREDRDKAIQILGGMEWADELLEYPENPEWDFWADTFIFTGQKTDVISKRDIYQAYVRWCRMTKVSNMSVNKFWVAVRAFGVDVDAMETYRGDAKGKRWLCIAGCAWRL